MAKRSSKAPKGEKVTPDSFSAIMEAAEPTVEAKPEPVMEDVPTKDDIPSMDDLTGRGFTVTEAETITAGLEMLVRGPKPRGPFRGYQVTVKAERGYYVCGKGYKAGETVDLYIDDLNEDQISEVEHLPEPHLKVVKVGL